MTNHTHLLVTPLSEFSLPQIMQAIGREYVQSLNKARGRTGALWQGRYKASPVQDDAYFLTCQRYIELNPVRAGMVDHPGEYPYSSYNFHALGHSCEILTPHSTYLTLSDNPERRRTAYRRLFLDELDQKQLNRIRNDTNACRVLGNSIFKRRIEGALGYSLKPGKVGRPRKN